MKILLHGNFVNRRWLFKCKKCGCVFEADAKEAYRECFFDNDGEVHKEVCCGCPDCGHRTISENSEGYEVEEE